MPSAPKYIKRRRGDFYPTPYYCTQLLLDKHILKPNSKIVECCAGRGHISKIIKEYHPDCSLVQYELYRSKHLIKYGNDITFGDFLQNVRYDEDVNYVITNPPFTLSQSFISTCIQNYPNAEIIMLLPLSFLGSAKRYLFWNKNTPTGIYILSDRPSFTGDGHTDSSVYGWFVFNGTQQPIQFLTKG